MKEKQNLYFLYKLILMQVWLQEYIKSKELSPQIPLLKAGLVEPESGAICDHFSYSTKIPTNF